MKKVPYKTIICTLAALCIVLSSMLIFRSYEKKQDEVRFMNHMYAELKDVSQEVDALLCKDAPQEGCAESLVRLHCALHNAAEELENGYRFVADCIPSVASFWFEDKAAQLSNHRQKFLTEQRALSAEGVAFLEKLNSDMDELITPLVGEDQMNLNTELSIQQFSDAIFDFYNSRPRS